MRTLFLITLLLGSISANGFKNLKSGESISFENLSSNEIYVDVWATWCLPCRKSMPVLDSLNQSGKYQIVALNADDDSKKALKFLERFKINLEVWINPDKEYLKTLAPPALPSLYVVNKKGEILRRLEAYNENELRKFFK